MDELFGSEGLVDGETRAKLLKAAIDEIKTNTCKLACRQVETILRMREEFGWQIHRLNAIGVFLRHGGDANEAWEKLVLEPSMNIAMKRATMFVLGSSTNSSHASLASPPSQRNTSVAFNRWIRHPNSSLILKIFST
ncbi:UNVERIFIED_CONTAM: hypothetical protein Sindi_1676900 [Sesamum indicum]